ncbi:MAG: hypothetical protein ABI210_05935 [Abditibacteriaceae bacterium]
MKNRSAHATTSATKTPPLRLSRIPPQEREKYFRIVIAKSWEPIVGIADI